MQFSKHGAVRDSARTRNALGKVVCEVLESRRLLSGLIIEGESGEIGDTAVTVITTRDATVTPVETPR